MVETKALWDWLSESSSIVIVDGLSSVALLVVILVLRTLLVRMAMKSPGLSVEARRRWVVSIRNTMAALFIVGLIFIWAHALSAFAVSLVAIAVALVLATKELLLCISGAVLRIGSDAYALGDRIAIGALRGNVLDQNLFATTLLEIGPGEKSQQYTGRVVVFPNSLLLSAPLINETYRKEYIVHVLTVPLTTEDDWQAAEKILLEAANAECGSFVDEAHQHLKQMEGKHWLDAPSVQPRVTLHMPEAGKVHLLLRFPAPAHRTSRLEQAILRRFLTSFKPIHQPK